MLSSFPMLTISLDADWRRSEDISIAALAKVLSLKSLRKSSRIAQVLLKHRERCKFRTGPATESDHLKHP